MRPLIPLDPASPDRFRRPFGASRPSIPFLAQDAKPKAKLLPPVRPNVGVQIAYRRKLLRLVDEMNASFVYWIRACYRANEPAMAQDATPAEELQRTIEALSKRWIDRFDEAAEDLAKYFAKRASARSDAALKAILRKGGYSVAFKPTPRMRDVMRASVAENVQLIKSIPQEYLTDVQGAVMRSVQRGGDLGSLAKELEQKYGVTRKRAAFIALDQNNKATSAMQAARQLDLGIEEGIWMHSHAGKEPRPTHVANDGKKFSIKDGWFDPDKRVRRRIMPGELPRCRCGWRPVIKGIAD